MEHLSLFFKAIASDPRISITHIGIYATLLQLWKEAEFANPIYIFSAQVKPVAKISSSTTYHRCIRDLHEFGYIQYDPSYKRNKGSQIRFLLNDNIAQAPLEINKDNKGNGIAV